MSRFLKIATCQFPVSADVRRNLDYILKQMATAFAAEADVVHFPECSLSGYAGTDFPSIAGVDEALLRDSLKTVAGYAGKYGLWAIVGGHYFDDTGDKPTNCLWLINDRGDLVDRYDKRICMGGPGEMDHLHYRPGRRAVEFKIRDVECGLLICHEWRYPEIYRDYMRSGVELIFQSWYDGNFSDQEYRDVGKNVGSLIVGTIRSMAANNHFWISASNTSRRESGFAACMVRPDGKITGKLKRNVTGVLISQLDLDDEYYDPSRPWREQVSNGILRSG